jgi:hypothetical protein
MEGDVGILMSLNGFTSSVLFDVEHHREQPILLISGDELRDLTGCGHTLSDLLWRKREALLSDGRVILDKSADTSGSSQESWSVPAKLISGDEYCCRRRTEQIVKCEGSFGRTVFANEFEDIDWAHAQGFGVTLDLRPAVRETSAES